MSTSPPSSSAGRSAKPKATVITGTAAALAVRTSTIESPIKATLPPPALAMVSERCSGSGLSTGRLRSEERRVGREGVRRGRARGSPEQTKQKYPHLRMEQAFREVYRESTKAT